jgi:hypothetical protein
MISEKYHVHFQRKISRFIFQEIVTVYLAQLLCQLLPSFTDSLKSFFQRAQDLKKERNTQTHLIAL